MHPVKPETGYMREVIAAAGRYRVDSFEICGDVHSSSGGLDGAIRFRDYPEVAGVLERAQVDDTIRTLREVVSLAHQSGRPVYYWHREVMVPRAIVERISGLIDEKGEFDLLGDAYQKLVRSKIAEFFTNVTGMDGLVLTLTESDFSVIHNSDPLRYPPREVVRKLVATFAKELHRRGKRFILRSFGSIAQDYEDILAGAELVRAATPFEIETKITPYDFSPFLRFNPYLKRSAGCTLSAEYDSIGEFLGAGFLPAADPARVIDSVAHARERGVDRHVIRIDRIGHPTFTSPQAVNLLAFDRAILDPEVTVERVWQEWASSHWPNCAVEMTAVMKRGIEMAKKTQFIDGHVIFHAFPIQPDLKWIQACGILSVFTPSKSLHVHPHMWGILPDRITPSRASLLREKDEAVEFADQGWADVTRLRDRLSSVEFDIAERGWRNATVASRAVRAWCRCVCAYFEDMEAGAAGHARLDRAVTAAFPELRAYSSETPGALAVATSMATSGVHEYGDIGPVEDNVDAAYVRPIFRHLALLAKHYEAEFCERTRWRQRPGIFDFVVCGGFIDDLRVDRSMHASHARLVNGRPARFAGNRVFPNGYMDFSLALPEARARLVILGDPEVERRFRLTIGGQTREAEFSSAGEYECEISTTGGPKSIDFRIQKLASEYPAIFGAGVIFQKTQNQEPLK
jgi:hypothetical protein